MQSLITETYVLQKALDGVEDDDERRTLEEDMTGKVRCTTDATTLLVNNPYDIDSTGMLARYLFRDRRSRNESISPLMVPSLRVIHSRTKLDQVVDHIVNDKTVSSWMRWTRTRVSLFI